MVEEADLKAFADESIDTPVEESVEPEEFLEDPIDEDYCEGDDESEVPSILSEAVILSYPYLPISYPSSSKLL